MSRIGLSLIQRVAPKHIKSTAPYLAVALLSLIGVVLVMRLWNADLSVPFAYSGDVLFAEVFVKTGIDNPWYLHNSFIGMPTGLDYYDFPFTGNLYTLWFKALSLITRNHFLIVNVYFLMTFPLTAITTLFVLRYFKIAVLPAIVVALLYTFVPYHFMRGIQHLFLSSYYLIPLVLMICLWVCSESPPFFEDPSRRLRPIINLSCHRTIFAVVVSGFVAIGDPHHGFFSMYFIAIAAIIGAASQKRLKSVVSAVTIIAVISIGMLVSMSPHLIYRWKHGPNPRLLIRSPAETEVYGLKLAQLLLPVTDHRIPIAAKLKARYSGFPLVNENDSSSLGLVGGLGFALLIWRLVFRRAIDSPSTIENHLSIFNGAAVLLGTVGGIGALLSLVITNPLRGYNRISVFIAFFSLFAVALVLDKIWKKYAVSRASFFILAIAFGLILLLGVADQTTEGFVPRYSEIEREFASDADFVRRVEASLPQGSMIFQLPYAPFPESPPVNRMKDYDLFRGYLHSRNLRWSYGAPRGREADDWQQAVTSKPLPELVKNIALVGFRGIYIDRNGYQGDSGSKLEKQLSDLLGTSFMVSNNRRHVFFDMGSYIEQLKATKLEPELKEGRQKVFNGVTVRWEGGSFGLESAPLEN